MGMPADTHQAASDAIAARGNFITVHTGAGGGTTGANEAAGVTRKPTAWTPDGAGNNNGSPVDIDVAAGTYTEGGIYSAVNGGTFVGSSPFAGGTVIVNGTGAKITVTPKTSA